MTSTQKSLSLKLRLSRSVGLSAFIVAVSGGVAFAQAVIVQGNRSVDAETIRTYATGGNGSADAIRQNLMATGLFSNVQVSRRGSQTVIAVARMQDGSFWQDSVDLLVTLAACIE